ncbi:hypothetical protein TA3x_000174 [Tundrisphaera sp. TA3]|uniref:hypothetical protein n=1 Tax=Tundrisphaera sp. TA3 TaxID=3435775 RepID=UPI003EB75B9F
MYYSHASTADRVEPGTLRGPIEVTPSPASTRPVGAASEREPLGPWIDDVDIGTVEATWELAIGGVPIPGRFLLRRGLFIRLDVEPTDPPAPGDPAGSP